MGIRARRGAITFPCWSPSTESRCGRGCSRNSLNVDVGGPNACCARSAPLIRRTQLVRDCAPTAHSPPRRPPPDRRRFQISGEPDRAPRRSQACSLRLHDPVAAGNWRQPARFHLLAARVISTIISITSGFGPYEMNLGCSTKTLAKVSSSYGTQKPGTRMNRIQVGDFPPH